jgi:RNA polymerase sigma-70 factor (ECF subfamily)
LRSLSHSPLDKESSFSDSANIPSNDNIEISLANKQLKELILCYTKELPSQQKIVFMLRDVEELEVTETYTGKSMPEVIPLSSQETRLTIHFCFK